MPNLRTSTRHQSSTSPSPGSKTGKNQRKAAKAAAKKISRQTRVTRKQEGSGDEEHCPSLSEVLKMRKFSALEIADSEGSLQEVIREGDW
jgi:hypothetical protein